MKTDSQPEIPIQQIVDHWHIGVVKAARDFTGFTVVESVHGLFAVFPSDRVGSLARCQAALLQAGYATKLKTPPRSAHVQGQHYQLLILEGQSLNQLIKIRRAREPDYTDVERLTRQLHQLDFKGVPGFLRNNPPVILARSVYLGVLESKTEAYFVAERASVVVGMLYVSRSEQGDDVMAKLREAEVGALYVDRAWRRQGIATALLVRSEKWARTRRANRLVTIVYPYAYAAAALYAKLGLQPRSIKLDKILD